MKLVNTSHQVNLIVFKKLEISSTLLETDYESEL